ncbi:response regulator transcription factor [Paenibacillus thalictri]|uniref:AraC family transcriptional regulator n=1 Tax=Paenibacillus thalictri TaxID=2527873 RepID=A0A4Q9DUQ3_9BACL|nr:AraC family transcriptional regulator [Paenibacillus thalictri]TBL78510.1 AraC family transcriptional regulator [Paenibacillus thalictri]
MYSVMLVDDDYPVVQYLAQIIPWEELNLRLQGMYDNPLEALKQAKAEMPDILITDIGMPLLSGIDLIEQLKNIDGDLYTIILSCYNDFRYAQQAVKLNVQDYILKETISSDMVVGQLRKLCKRLDEARENRKRQDKLKLILHGSKAELKQKFLLETLHHPIWHPEDWLETLKQYGIDLAAHSCLIVLYRVERYEETKTILHMTDDMLVYAVENITDEVAGSSLGAISLRYSAKAGFMLIPSPDERKENEYLRVLERVQEALKTYLKADVSFYIGEWCQQPCELKSVMRRQLLALESGFYLPEKYIGTIQEAEFSKDDLFASFSSALDELKRLILQEDAEGMEAAVAKWIDFIEMRRFSPDIAKEWALKLILDLRLKFKLLQGLHTAYSDQVLHGTMSEIDNVNRLKSWILAHLNEMLMQMGAIVRQSQRGEIRKAHRYVENHLDQKITLEEVADHLHLNPSYFSRLYKKETGLTFIEYVIQTKMGKAKELLDHTDKTVEEIAYMLGYDNKSYFIRLFKNEIGLPPREYSGKSQTKG